MVWTRGDRQIRSVLYSNCVVQHSLCRRAKGRKSRMSQSLSSTEESSIAVGSLEERLRAHPHLCERIEALLNIVDNTASDLEQAV